MQTEDRHWLAGLLEGEGYFGTVNCRVGGKLYRYPRVGVNMTDLDIIERVAALWSVKVQVLKPTGPRSVLTQYRVTLVGSRAAALMEDLRPLMGGRRRGQIDRALNEYKALAPTAERRSESCRKAALLRWRGKEE